MPKAYRRIGRRTGPSQKRDSLTVKGLTLVDILRDEERLKRLDRRKKLMMEEEEAKRTADESKIEEADIYTRMQMMEITMKRSYADVLKTSRFPRTGPGSSARGRGRGAVLKERVKDGTIEEKLLVDNPIRPADKLKKKLSDLPTYDTRSEEKADFSKCQTFEEKKDWVIAAVIIRQLRLLAPLRKREDKPVGSNEFHYLNEEEIRMMMGQLDQEEGVKK